MVIKPLLYTANVMHKRLSPKENSFNYGVYYLVLPLPAPPVSGFFANFDAKDLGKRDGSDPESWARAILRDYGLNKKTENIILVTMPRILGYLFNPVSFYLCLDKNKGLRAVLCEVHNTFGEQHTYLCANPDHKPISGNIWLEAEKIFHVSPFLERAGDYKFRFDLKPNSLGIWIDYYNPKEGKQLITSLIGSFTPLTGQTLRKAFWAHPLVTMKVITLIHWQALKLLMKGVRYITKPEQVEKKVSATRNIKKIKGKK